MMRGPRWLFGGSSRLRARDIAGCVIVGGNSGIVYQIYNGGALPEPPSLPWDDDLSAPGPFEIFNLLHWSSRLSRQLIGRGREKKDLHDWAGGGRDLRIRLLTGPGGAGKTRLAAELAASLRQAGWQAGVHPAREQRLATALCQGAIADHRLSGGMAGADPRAVAQRRANGGAARPSPRTALEPPADGSLA
jgi:hypothetical protein